MKDNKPQNRPISSRSPRGLLIIDEVANHHDERRAALFSEVAEFIEKRPDEFAKMLAIEPVEQLPPR